MKKIEELPNGNLRIVRPVTICNLRHRHSIVLTEELPELQAQSPLLLAIAHAVDWQQKLDSGQYASIEELAVAVGKERSMVSRTLRLALLSPEIIHHALTGGLPITAKALLFASIPADWEEQKKWWGWSKKRAATVSGGGSGKKSFLYASVPMVCQLVNCLLLICQ